MMTARGAATTAAGRHGGNRAIVGVLVQPNVLFADEDDVQFTARPVIPGFNPTDSNIFDLYLSWRLGLDQNWVQKCRVAYVAESIHTMAGKMRKDTHPQLLERLQKLLSEAWEVALVRQASHALEINRQIFEPKIVNELCRANNKPWAEQDPKEIKSIAPPPASQAEAKWASMVDKITRTMKGIATSPEEIPWHTARCPLPIGFSGPNRILFVIEIVDSSKGFTVIPRYGQVDEEFLKQWEAQSGPWKTAPKKALISASFNLQRFLSKYADNFLGEHALKAPFKDLETAQAMELQGKDPHEIWKATGWARGEDEKWRFEIDSDKMRMLPVQSWWPHYWYEEVDSDGTIQGGTQLDQVIKYPALFRNHPWLRQIRIRPYEGTEKDTEGEYWAPGELADNWGYHVIRIREGLGDQATREVLLHELQHAIQSTNGFPYDHHIDYEQRPAEIEAEDVIHRSTFPPEERKQSLPAVSRLRQIRQQEQREQEEKAALDRQQLRLEL